MGQVLVGVLHARIRRVCPLERQRVLTKAPTGFHPANGQCRHPQRHQRCDPLSHQRQRNWCTAARTQIEGDRGTEIRDNSLLVDEG